MLNPSRNWLPKECTPKNYFNDCKGVLHEKCTSLTKWLTVFLLIFTFAAAPSFKAQAADLILIEDDQDAELPMQEEDGSVGLPVIEDDTAAPALPESGLPVLSDYEDTSDSPGSPGEYSHPPTIPGVRDM